MTKMNTFLPVDAAEIFARIDPLLPRITELRHRIHQFPELAGDEHQTSALVRATLAETAAQVLPPFLDTDVVALLFGHGQGKNVTLRADLDALPLSELNSLPYASTRPGLMHACGHDAHTAMLLGAALVLNQLRERFVGSVRFVFQPGEEMMAMGRDLVAAGALAAPEPAAVFALHGAAGRPLGAIISRPGPMMAAASHFKITITGQGGHGCRPESAIDPILVGAQVVTALQTIVSRRLDPQAAAVISVCRFCAGQGANSIPESAELEGTTRFLGAAVGEKIPGLMETVIQGVCQAAGAQYRFDYRLPYQPLINDPACVSLARAVTETLFSPSGWLDLPQASMGAEDFCYYLSRYPGAFCYLGIGEDRPPTHSPHFDFNDDALRYGMAFHCATALAVLNS